MPQELNRRKITERQREDQALHLRISGLSLTQIAEHLGYRDASGARKAIKRALDRQPTEDAAHVRAIQSERLERLWAVAIRQTMIDHVAHSFGKVVLDTDGHPLVDEAAKLGAVRTCITVLARQADLFGLDAPPKRRIEVITEDVIEAEIARLEKELGVEPGGDLPPAP